MKIDPAKGLPSQQAIDSNIQSLVRYAAISQAHGLVPIVEPELLMEGSHNLETCAYWTEKVLSMCFRALNEHHVVLEGIVLKPNMVVPGKGQ